MEKQAEEVKEVEVVKEKSSSSKSQKRQGTYTYKREGANIGMPLESNRKVRGMGAGKKTKEANKRKKVKKEE